MKLFGIFQKWRKVQVSIHTRHYWRVKRAKQDEKPVSRMKALNGADPPLPPLTDGYHLIEHLMEVGPVASNGMGIVPVSYSELQAWRSGCGHHLDAWEFSLLRDLSVAYCSELQDAESPTAPPPWVATPAKDERIDIAKRIKGVLRG